MDNWALKCRVLLNNITQDSLIHCPRFFVISVVKMQRMTYDINKLANMMDSRSVSS